MDSITHNIARFSLENVNVINLLTEGSKKTALNKQHLIVEATVLDDRLSSLNLEDAGGNILGRLL
jgi:hypothetical protein